MSAPETHHRWHGRWIWDHTDGTEKNAYVLFRRTFELQDAPAAGTLRISAMSRYRLYVNGELVGDGPPKSQPYLTYYDEYPVAGRVPLRPGDNVIAVVVQHVGYDDDSRGGLLAELSVDPAPRDAAGDTAGDEPLIVTDRRWRVTRSPAWRADTFFCFFNRVVPYQEHFDARKLSPRWTDARFDDSDWAPAAIVTSAGSDQPPQVFPWTRLVPRDIPFMDEQPSYAVSVAEVGEATYALNRMRPGDLSLSLSQPALPLEHAVADDTDALTTASGTTALACSTLHRSDPTAGIREPLLLLDFGRIINGYVELDVEGPAGAQIEIGYAERLLDGQFNNAIEGQFADALTLPDGRRRWRAFAWKAFRYLRLRVHSAFVPITVHSLTAIETRYPYEARGSFATPDEELAGIFRICRRTVELCSNEYITDTPWREQGQWLGDVAAVTLGAIHACFGDTRLARKFLRQSGATQYANGFLGNMTNTFSHRMDRLIVDFSLWWVMAVRDHYRYTGEEAIVHELYPVAVRLIESVLGYRNADGLVEDVPGWIFIDWADVDRSGACAAFNAILAGALGATAELASVRGDSYMESRAREARAGIERSFARVFWDADERLFCDAVAGGVSTGRFSEQTNAAAILFDLADAEQTVAIIERLWARGDNFLAGTNNGVSEANPFFSSVILRALSAADRPDLALRLIRDRWGRRMLDLGSTSTHEEWSVHGSWRHGERFLPIMRTLSHAWSAFPARWLIEHLAGITIEEPGCRTVRVRPVPTEFDYDVTFPTPAGSVAVRCRNGRVDVRATGDVALRE